MSQKDENRNEYFTPLEKLRKAIKDLEDTKKSREYEDCLNRINAVEKESGLDYPELERFVRRMTHPMVRHHNPYFEPFDPELGNDTINYVKSLIPRGKDTNTVLRNYIKQVENIDRCQTIQREEIRRKVNRIKIAVRALKEDKKYVVGGIEYLRAKKRFEDMQQELDLPDLPSFPTLSRHTHTVKRSRSPRSKSRSKSRSRSRSRDRRSRSRSRSKSPKQGTKPAPNWK
jgi:predicted nuclease with TOPRIM domain